MSNRASANTNSNSTKANIAANKLIIDPAGASLLSGHAARSLDHMEVNGVISLHYLNQPLLLRDEDSSKVLRRLVNHRESIHLGVAIGLWSFAEAGLTLPLIGYQKGRLPGSGSGEVATTGLGDTDLYVQSNIIDEKQWPLSLGAQLSVQLPTGNSNAYMGTGRFTIEPGIIASKQIGPVTLEGAVGFRGQSQTKLSNYTDGNQWTYRISTRYPSPSDLWAFQLDWIGATAASKPFDRSHSPSEVLGTVWYQFSDTMRFLFGSGAGVTPGFGAPTFRVFAGISLNSKSMVDNDYDGIPHDNDLCPEQAEDFDGFQDEDGCPEDDNDSDGLLNEVDSCPLEPEDTDNWEDDDGCPDPDNDEDHILDTNDQCPNEKEDKDDFQDDDGCPELDNDQDGISDSDDQCPNDKETINNHQDEDGCPDSAPQSNSEQELIQINDGQLDIKLDGIVFFDKGKAFLKRPARPVLNALVALLKKHQQLEKLLIIGHTDNKGSKRLNKRLSRRRAFAVKRYLVKRGIQAKRVAIMGAGSEQPRASNKKRWGQRVNRRVEFRVEQWAAGQDSSTGDSPSVPKSPNAEPKSEVQQAPN